MAILTMLQAEARTKPYKVASMAALAGVANALILAIVNLAASNVSTDGVSLRMAAMFALAMGIYALSQRYIMVISATEVENIIHRIRVNLSEKIRHADLLSLQRAGQSEIFAVISRETQTISQVIGILVIGCQSAILVFFTLLYIAVLSKTAFIISVGFTVLAASIHLHRAGVLRGQYYRAMTLENSLFDRLRDLLDGFKEVKLNIARGDELEQDFNAISSQTADAKIGMQRQSADAFIFSQVSFYLLIGTMVFIVPIFSQTISEVVMKTSTAILFLIGPISNLVQAIPMFAAANAATDNIQRLETVLDAAATDKDSRLPSTPQASFKEIQFEGVTFSYVDALSGTRFSVGPFDITLKQGETVFVTGGNGAGKSTFLKLLTGLYKPEGGVIRLDGEPLDPRNYARYRSMFSAVFTDYHLFRRLYGLGTPENAVLADLLKTMEIDKKVAVQDREFDTIELSGGQRKRLALIVTILERRPIIVLDEWAADQDPIFRRKFYEELLPIFKAEGKTILAVTHDDRYFHMSDRQLRMEEGRFTTVTGQDEGASA
jgi:putative ATP-binding cassette transporter